MYSIETHTASAVHNVRDAAAKAEKAGANLDRRMTEAFVAYIAASPDATAKTASAYIGDKVPASKESGHPASVRKSRCVSYFKDSANLAAVRAAIPSPDAMSPDDFQTAVETYAKDINPRKWLADQKAAKATVAETQAETRNDNRPEPEAEAGGVLNPEYDPVLDCQTAAAKAISSLADNASDDATAALETLAAMIEKALAARAVETARTGTDG